MAINITAVRTVQLLQELNEIDEENSRLIVGYNNVLKQLKPNTIVNYLKSTFIEKGNYADTGLITDSTLSGISCQLSTAISSLSSYVNRLSAQYTDFTTTPKYKELTANIEKLSTAIKILEDSQGGGQSLSGNSFTKTDIVELIGRLYGRYSFTRSFDVGLVKGVTQDDLIEFLNISADISALESDQQLSVALRYINEDNYKFGKYDSDGTFRILSTDITSVSDYLNILPIEILDQYSPNDEIRMTVSRTILGESEVINIMYSYECVEPYDDSTTDISLISSDIKNISSDIYTDSTGLSSKVENISSDIYTDSTGLSSKVDTLTSKVTAIENTLSDYTELTWKFTMADSTTRTFKLLVKEVSDSDSTPME